MNSLATSLIRTLVPMIVGGFVAWMTARGHAVNAQDEATLATVLTAAFSWLYYLIARLLESKNPNAGYLLGVPRQPIYTNKR